MNTIKPYDLVKVNKLNINAFKNECVEQGITWNVGAKQINEMRFRVAMTIGTRRAFLMDTKNGGCNFWVSQSLLKVVKETIDDTNERPNYNND